MSKVHILELIVELDKQIDDGFCKVGLFGCIDGCSHGFEEVHELQDGLYNYSNLVEVLLFLLWGWNFDGFDYPENPVLSFDAFPFTLDEF